MTATEFAAFVNEGATLHNFPGIDVRGVCLRATVERVPEIVGQPHPTVEQVNVHAWFYLPDGGKLSLRRIYLTEDLHDDLLVFELREQVRTLVSAKRVHDTLSPAQPSKRPPGG